MFINNTKHGYTGLLNLGNTCYMNSILQVLANNLKMTEYYICFKADEKNKYKNFLKNYVILINEMWKGNNIIKPTTFKNSVNYFLNKYNNTYQHDAHEFLTDILNILHESSLKKEAVFSTESASSFYINAVKEWRFTLNNSSSFITKEFYGQYIIKYKCNNCSQKKYKYDVFSCLYLNIPNKIKKCDLSFLIQKHFEYEYISIQCDKCNLKIQHKISKKIFKLPKTLIMVIKRYSPDSSKNPLELTPCEILNFENYYVDKNKKNSVKYELNSIVCNNGDTLNSGHYYSVIKRNGAYNVYDDNKIYNVKKIKGSHVVDSYVLFYSKK